MDGTRQIDTGQLAYTIVDDFTSRYFAVITGVVTDEMFGALDASDLTIRTNRAELDTKATNGGAFAVTGYVNPKSYTVNLTVSATGFADYTASVSIPANATTPTAAPAIALRRMPVRVQGRVVTDTTSRTPIAGAKIVAVDDPSSPPPSTHLLALLTTLSLRHSAGATVREIAMSPIGSASLNADAVSGTRALNLSTRAGLAVNSVIQLTNPSGTQVSYAIVGSPVSGLGPGMVALRDPLNTSFRAATALIQFLSPGAAGASAVLNAGADSGDGVLLLSALLTGSTLEIDPGSPSVEYRETGALTDADGYYAINGIGRSAEIFLEASHSGFASKISPWPIEFDNPVNVLDFRL